MPEPARLPPDLRAAIERWIAEQSRPMTVKEAVVFLLRDQMIGLGLLPLGGANRSKGARRG